MGIGELGVACCVPGALWMLLLLVARACLLRCVHVLAYVACSP